MSGFCVFATLGCVSLGRGVAVGARATFEECLKGSGEDRGPALRGGQLLRSFDEGAQKHGDGAERLGGGNRLGVRAGDGERRLSRMAGARGDGVQQQGPTGDRLPMPVRFGQTNEDVPPIVEQRDEARGYWRLRRTFNRSSIE